MDGANAPSRRKIRRTCRVHVGKMAGKIELVVEPVVATPAYIEGSTAVLTDHLLVLGCPPDGDAWAGYYKTGEAAAIPAFAGGRAQRRNPCRDKPAPR